MASSYTGLGTELMTTGENAGTWGTTTNTNLQIIEQISGGYIEKSIAGSAQTTTLSVVPKATVLPDPETYLNVNVYVPDVPFTRMYIC